MKSRLSPEAIEIADAVCQELGGVNFHQVTHPEQVIMELVLQGILREDNKTITRAKDAQRRVLALAIGYQTPMLPEEQTPAKVRVDYDYDDFRTIQAEGEGISVPSNLRLYRPELAGVMMKDHYFSARFSGVPTPRTR